MASEPVSRRAFLRLALFPLAASAAAALAGCRIGTTGPEDAPPLEPAPIGDAPGFVFDNHQHSALLAASDLQAGLPVTLHIRGRSPHDHVVELTAAQVADIRAGREVTVPSTNDYGHAHDVTFNFHKAA